MSSSRSIVSAAAALAILAALGSAPVRAESKAEPIAVTTENGKIVRVSAEARKSRAFFWLFLPRQDAGQRVTASLSGCSSMMCPGYVITGIGF